MKEHNSVDRRQGVDESHRFPSSSPDGGEAAEERVNGERVRVSHPPAMFNDKKPTGDTYPLEKKTAVG